MVKSHEKRDAVLFLLPIGIVYLGFLFGPILGTIIISFTEYDIIAPMKFIGLENYRELFQSERSLGIYVTTFEITIILIVLHAIIGLLLAMAVVSLQGMYQGVFRILFYTPVVITTASMAIAWKYMFNYDFGAINWVIASLGFDRIPWVASSQYVYASIAMFSVWKFVGNAFIYYYIGLKSLPETYYEVAYIDGAGPWARFRHVTLPLLSPTIFFVVMILCIQTVQIFDEPFFLTGGGPGDASRTINLHVYEVAFQRYDIGTASAITVTLLLLLIAFTAFQVYFSRKWVNYDR